MEYQLCAGTNPLRVADQKINLPLLATYFVTLVVNAAVPFKIYGARVEDRARRANVRFRVQGLTLYSFTTSVVVVVTTSFSLLTVLLPYGIRQDRVVEAKYQPLAFLFTAALPQLTVGLTLAGYLAKHTSLRKGLWRNALEFWNDR